MERIEIQEVVSRICQFIGTGWYLFSGNTTTNLRRDYSSRRRVVLGDWNSKVDHWFIDGSLAYGFIGFSALLGVRYDYLSTERDSPDPVGFYNGRARALEENLDTVWGIPDIN